MSALVVAKIDSWTWVVSGDTWSYREILRSTPGLSWNPARRAVEGRGDAISTFLARAGCMGAKLVGALPEFVPGSSSFSPFEPLSQTDGHKEAARLQNTSARWASDTGFEGAILAHPTGAGKTPISIVAAIRAKPATTKIVLCPAFLRTNWKAEIAKYSPIGTEWIVTSYDALLKPDVFDDLKHIGAGCLILDEAHAVKNLSGQGAAKRAKRAAELARGIPWRIALTATPVFNRRKDLWGVAEVVRPGGLGGFWPFAMRYLNAHKNLEGFWELDGPKLEDLNYKEITDELRERMRWFYQRYENLTSLLVGVSKGRRVVRWLSHPDDEEPFRPEGPLGVNTALRQSSRWKAVAACAMAREHLEQGEKVLIFTWTKEQARMIATALDTVCVTGDVLPDRRIAAASTAEGRGVLVTTLDSLGMGVNLPWIDVTIFADMDWLPLKLIQAEGRSWRKGRTTPPVYEYLAVKGTCDEAVISTVVDKLDTYSDLVADDDAGALSKDLRPVQRDDILEGILAKMRDAGPEPVPSMIGD